MFARASSNDEIQKTYRVYVTTDLFKQRSESNDPWKTTAGKGKEGTLHLYVCFCIATVSAGTLVCLACLENHIYN